MNVIWKVLTFAYFVGIGIATAEGLESFRIKWEARIAARKARHAMPPMPKDMWADATVEEQLDVQSPCSYPQCYGDGCRHCKSRGFPQYRGVA